MTPPFKPEIANSASTENFDSLLTSAKPVDSPASSPPKPPLPDEMLHMLNHPNKTPNAAQQPRQPPAAAVVSLPPRTPVGTWMDAQLQRSCEDPAVAIW